MTLSHSLSAHLFAYEPLSFAHLQASAEVGFTRVELFAMTPHFDVKDPGALSRLRSWLVELSLEPVSFHAPFYVHLEAARAGNWLSLSHPDGSHRRQAVERTEAAMRALGELGARTVVLHPGGPGAGGAGDTFEGLRESVERLLPLAEHLEMTLALENIAAPLGRPEAVGAFVEEFAHPRLRACLDVGHAHLTEGERLESTFRRLAPLAAAIHLHDNDGKQDAHLIPGEGAVRWPPLWEALEAAGYRGLLAFEIRRREGEPYGETLAALARAAARLPATSSAGSSSPKSGTLAAGAAPEAERRP